MTYPVDWWHERKNELISLFHVNSPVYIYHEEVIKDIQSDWFSIDAVESLFYPFHINHHLSKILCTHMKPLMEILDNVDQVYRNKENYYVKSDADIEDPIQQGVFNERRHRNLNPPYFNEDSTILVRIMGQYC